MDANGTLVLYNTGPMNEGSYRCNGANNFGMRSRTVDVTIIMVPPKLKHKRFVTRNLKAQNFKS